MKERIEDKLDQSELFTTKLAGTGLGISQRIAHKLGSEVKVSSTVGVGSKFWFEICIKRNDRKSDSHKISETFKDINFKKNELNKWRLSYTIHSKSKSFEYWFDSNAFNKNEKISSLESIESNSNEFQHLSEAIVPEEDVGIQAHHLGSSKWLNASKIKDSENIDHNMEGIQ